ncbi:MAG TPA: hypothetical protein VGG40_01615 [Solirubrobacterales bacterium]|jgi:hypothetical protein
MEEQSVHQQVVANEEGGYRFLPALRFASAAVLAMDGMAIERGVLTAPLPLADGFAAIRAWLEAAGRPLDSLCGIELRSPNQISMDDFIAFNNQYLSHLDSWDLLRDGAPPLTRTNVAPFRGAPATPSIVAFSYTVERADPRGCFVVSGVAEVATGCKYPDDIIRPGESSSEALNKKASSVTADVGSIVAHLGADWDDAVSVHLYAQHPSVFEFSRRVLAAIPVAPNQGIVWHDAAPPVDGLELEVDIRRYAAERAVGA